LRTRNSEVHEIEYVHGGIEWLDEIGPLWEKLNALHGELSPHFADSFRNGSFSKRKAELLTKSQTARLHVDLAREHDSMRPLGYCISTVDPDEIGEIESLFVDEGCRRRGIGGQLMTTALSWMAKEGAKKKRLLVAFGNDAAINFYKRFGFCPRNIELVQGNST
jgi:ribosomal protein S18 acetylase RimI-like enzyme